MGGWTFTQTQTNSELSLGCNADGHMLQSAAVSKETYHETMRHNNSFPWEASGVEPIVCTLLRLWMLPLLRRAYINLACSKAALWRSALPLRVAFGVVAAVKKKKAGCIRPSPHLRLNLAGLEVGRMQTQAARPIHQHDASRQTGLRKSFTSIRPQSRRSFGKVERKVEFRFDSHMQWGWKREGKTLTVGTHLRERRCKPVSHTVTKTKLRHSPNRGSALCLCSSRYLSLPENGPRSFAQPAQCHLCSCRALITC